MQDGEGKTEELERSRPIEPTVTAPLRQHLCGSNRQTVGKQRAEYLRYTALYGRTAAVFGRKGVRCQTEDIICNVIITFKRQPPTCHYDKTGALLLLIIRNYVPLGGLFLFRLRFSVKWVCIKARISDSKYHVLW